MDGAARLLDVRDQGSFVLSICAMSQHSICRAAMQRRVAGERIGQHYGTLWPEEDVPRVHTLLTPEHGGGWSIDDLLVASADLWDRRGGTTSSRQVRLEAASCGSPLRTFPDHRRARALHGA